MTEFSPLFEEFESELSTPEYVNVRESPEWAEFIDAIASADRDLVLYHGDEPTEQEVMERIVEITQPVSDMLPSFVNQPCQVLGRGYRAHQEEHDTPPVPIDSSDFMLYKPDICHIAGQWRVVLRLYNARRTEDLDYGFYYVLPEDPLLMDLRVKPRHEDEIGVDDVVGSLHNYVTASRKLVASRDFAKLPADQQRTVLEQCISDLYESLPGELYDIDMPVECSRYYIEPDNAPRSQWTYYEGEKVTLIGKVEDFDYPELRHLALDQQLTLKDFTMNAGAACMQLRVDGALYHILPQSVTEIA